MRRRRCRGERRKLIEGLGLMERGRSINNRSEGEGVEDSE